MFPLLALRFRLFKNGVWPPSWPLVGKMSLVLGFTGIFGAGLFFGVQRAFGYLFSLEGLSPFFVTDFGENMLAMVYLLCFSMLLFSALTASLSQVFLSDDLILLHGLPVSAGRVFQIKFWDTVLTSSYVVMVLIIPILLAMGKAFGGTALYFWTLPFVLLAFIVAPASLGTGVTLVLMRFLPADKTKRIVTVISLLFMVILVMLLRFMQPEALFQTENTDELQELMAQVSLPPEPWLPSTWAASIHFSLLNAYPEGALLPALYLFGFALGIWGLVSLLARRYYYDAWGKARLSEKVTLGHKKPLGEKIFAPLFQKLPAQSRAFLLKDLRLFFRDTSQWSQLILLVALVIIYLYNIKSLQFPQQSIKNMMTFMNMGIAGCVLTALAARFVYPAVSIEGRAMWVVFSTPVGLRRMLWHKFAMAFFPMFVLVEFLMWASNRILEVDSYIMGLSLTTTFLMTLALTGLGIGLGAMMPQFEAENAARVAVSGGALLYMGVSFVYVGLVMAIEARPVYFHFMHMTMGLEFGSASWPFYAAVLVMSLLLAIVPVYVGAKKLEKYEM